MPCDEAPSRAKEVEVEVEAGKEVMAEERMKDLCHDQISELDLESESEFRTRRSWRPRLLLLLGLGYSWIWRKERYKVDSFTSEQ